MDKMVKLEITIEQKITITTALVFLYVDNMVSLHHFFDNDVVRRIVEKDIKRIRCAYLAVTDDDIHTEHVQKLIDEKIKKQKTGR
ncbi:hypothetical protein [Paenibacillus alvei]|uniref:hypothetical protein n=1 Tax=Paenibacillus alvei TaxID=44250 RepID=UPI002280BB54|nr:hypothetical protein [Paenibacillus alvei]